jgi:hypothetical protein
MGNAVATLVGQNLGAGKPERAERSVWIVGVYNMAFLLGVMAVFLWGAEPLIAVFSSDFAVQQLGALCLRVVSYGYAFYAWGMVLLARARPGATRGLPRHHPRGVAPRGGGAARVPPGSLERQGGLSQAWLGRLRSYCRTDCIALRFVCYLTEGDRWRAMS